MRLFSVSRTGQMSGFDSGKSMAKKSPFKNRLKEIMEPYQGGPGATRASLAADILILFCIIVSCALLPISHYRPEYEDLCMRFEIAFTVIFVVEYLLRWYVAEKRLLYPFTFYALIDLAAILPTLLHLTADLLMLRSLRGVRILRILRLLRLIRLLKFIRYGFMIYKSAIAVRIWLSCFVERYRLKALQKLFLVTLLAWIMGANLLYLTEAELFNHEGPYGGYWDSYWHIIIVLVSGIEDKEPLSLLGRIEVTILLIMGICFVGLITGEIVSILVYKIQRAGKVVIKPSKTELERHIVIVGRCAYLDNVIRQLVAVLGDRNYILIVHRNADEIMITDPSVYRKVLAIPGDLLEAHVLVQARLEKALRMIVFASDDDPFEDPMRKDNRTLMKMLAVHCRNRAIPIVVEILDEASLRYTNALESVEFVVARDFGVRLISQAVLNPGVSDIFYELMTLTGDSNEFYTIPVPCELVGKTFRDAQLFFLDMDEEDVVLFGIDRSPRNCPNSKFYINPANLQNGLAESGLVLKKDDKLLTIAYTRPSFAKITERDLWEGRVII